MPLTESEKKQIARRVRQAGMIFRSTSIFNRDRYLEIGISEPAKCINMQLEYPWRTLTPLQQKIMVDRLIRALVDQGGLSRKRRRA